MKHLPITERERLSTLPPRFRFEVAVSAPADVNGKASRTFVGLAAAYGNVFDRWSWEEGGLVATVLTPGTFAGTIAEINARDGIRKGNIPLMWEHYEAIGRSLSLEDAPEGVRISARVTDTPEFDRYVALIADGTANGMSIGFNILESTIVTTNGDAVEHVTKGELMEITACLWGANSIPYIQAAASRAIGSRELLAGKVLSGANQRDLECITADAARIMARAVKEAEKEEDGDGASLSTARQLEYLNLRIETLEAASGRRKEQ